MLNKICIRQAEPTDAPLLVRFMQQLYNESEYLLYDSEEWHHNIEVVKKHLTRMEEGQSVIFIAERLSNEIVGFVGGTVSPLKRLAHVMHVNIGVLNHYQGIGLGGKLSARLNLYAHEAGIERIEAMVIQENKYSLNLCKKFGFSVEGIKKRAIKINNANYDVVLLSLFLSS